MRDGLPAHRRAGGIGAGVFRDGGFAVSSYLCITYTLSSSFQHIGIGLCIIMVFVQIPGGTGLYPVEMTDAFFRTVYPMFPFTYGINALRETIGGFYGTQWLGYCGCCCSLRCPWRW